MNKSQCKRKLNEEIYTQYTPDTISFNFSGRQSPAVVNEGELKESVKCVENYKTVVSPGY